MSWRELVDELRLENRIIAITRVSSKNEELNDVGGCIYKQLGRVLGGEALVLGKGSCSCTGFDHNSGLKDEKPMIPGGFGLFLSKGSNQMWTPPGERFKCDPETAEAMFDSLPKNVMDGLDAIKFEAYKEGMNPDIVVILADADQLSALLVLHGYHRGEYDNAIATTASGCASMLRIPFAEMKKDRPKAVITATDIAQRHFVDEKLLALSVAASDFDRMLSVTSECFFHSPVFKKIRERIYKDEGSKEKRFSILA